MCESSKWHAVLRDVAELQPFDSDVELQALKKPKPTGTRVNKIKLFLKKSVYIVFLL